MSRDRIEGLQCRLTCSSITGREQVRWGAVWHQLPLSLIRFYRFATLCWMQWKSERHVRLHSKREHLHR